MVVAFLELACVLGGELLAIGVENHNDGQTEAGGVPILSICIRSAVIYKRVMKCSSSPGRGKISRFLLFSSAVFILDFMFEAGLTLHRFTLH